MQSIGRRYVPSINATYHRTGTLWEGRYRASVVDAEAYFLLCSRFIELNPAFTQQSCNYVQRRIAASYSPLLAQLAHRAVVAFDVFQHARHPERRYVSGPQSRGPHVCLPMHRRWHFGQRRERRGRPARAGSPLAGRGSHPLDDTQHFMEDLRPPIPIDPQGLVALQCLSSQLGRTVLILNKSEGILSKMRTLSSPFSSLYQLQTLKIKGLSITTELFKTLVRKLHFSDFSRASHGIETFDHVVKGRYAMKTTRTKQPMKRIFIILSFLIIGSFQLIGCADTDSDIAADSSIDSSTGSSTGLSSEFADVVDPDDIDLFAQISVNRNDYISSNDIDRYIRVNVGELTTTGGTGTYRIYGKMDYSGDKQPNESYFLILINKTTGEIVFPSNSNSVEVQLSDPIGPASVFVIQDVNHEDEVTRLSGEWTLPSGTWEIDIYHYVNIVNHDSQFKVGTGQFDPNTPSQNEPNSVHILDFYVEAL